MRLSSLKKVAGNITRLLISGGACSGLVTTACCIRFHLVSELSLPQIKGYT